MCYIEGLNVHPLVSGGNYQMKLSLLAGYNHCVILPHLKIPFLSFFLSFSLFPFIQNAVQIALVVGCCRPCPCSNYSCQHLFAVAVYED